MQWSIKPRDPLKPTQAQPGLPRTLLQAQLPGTLLHGLAQAVGRSGLLLLLLLCVTTAPVSGAAGRLGAAGQHTKLLRTLTEKSLIIALLRLPVCSLPPLLMHQPMGPRESWPTCTQVARPDGAAGTLLDEPRNCTTFASERLEPAPGRGRVNEHLGGVSPGLPRPASLVGLYFAQAEQHLGMITTLCFGVK